MRWLMSLWLDLWRGPFTATPGPAPFVQNIALPTPRPVIRETRRPRAFTFDRRQ